MPSRSIQLSRAGLAVLSLMLSSGICLVLLVTRVLVLKEHGFGFIPKNLILAWIPLLAALAIYALQSRGARRRPLIAVFSVAWFLFYPNAPYLITDLVHLRWYSPVPHWFDLLLMMSFAWTGLFLGNLSLYLMQEMVLARFGRTAGWIFVVAMLWLGSVGVFLGRFWRWNSNDAFLHPGNLAGHLSAHLRETSPSEGMGFAITFFAFSLLTYTTLYTFAHLHSALAIGARSEEPPDPSREKAIAVEARLR